MNEKNIIIKADESIKIDEVFDENEFWLLYNLIYKMKFIKLVLLLLSVIKCDLPIECYKDDIVGRWEIDITELKI